MTETDPTEPETGNSPAPTQDETRRTRGIRFPDSEWEAVKTAAESHDVSVAEFVRDKILEIARGRAGADPAAIPGSLAPLIKRTFRYTWLLATHKRDELIQAGLGEEVDELAKEARELRDRSRARTDEKPFVRGHSDPQTAIER